MPKIACLLIYDIIKMEASLQDFIKDLFYTDFLEALKTFVRIESLSPLYDPEWKTNRNLFKQSDHLVSFLHSQGLKGVTVHQLEDEGRSPFLIV